MTTCNVYKRAKLVPLETDPDSHGEIVGDAIVMLSRGTTGEAEMTGTFRTHETVKGARYGVPIRYTYQGMASEGSRQFWVEVLVTVIHREDGLHELTSVGQLSMREQQD